MSTDVLAIIAIALGALTRALGADLPGFKSLSKAWRAVIVAGIGIAQGIVDMMVAGSPIGVAALSVLKTTAPSFVLLIVEALFGGSSGAGLDGVASGSGKVSASASDENKAKLVKGPWARAWIAAMALCLACSAGCTKTGMVQVASWIQQAIEVEQNMSAIVSALRAAKDMVFAVAPPSENVRKAVESAFADEALAESAISELLNAGDAATQEQLDAGYAHLKNAYSNLRLLLVELGIVHSDAGGALKALRHDGSMMSVPTPLAFRVRVVKQ